MIETAFFTAGDTLKVIVIGNDGNARSALVDRKTTMVENKYIVTPKDVFYQRVKKYDLFWIDQPTILFRQNSINAVSPKGEDSYPTPQETADTIENTAMHLFTLFGKESNLMLIILMIIAGIAAGGGCTGAYFAYQNNKILTDEHAHVLAIESSLANMTSGYSSGAGALTTAMVPGGTTVPVVVSTPGLPKV